ncbi:MAG: recombinase family protein [Candidatus Thiodiazotropha sp. (ex Monitilora ramsayi)]|nr:recombinase family protein [Candidatus Thiodiazotropha sp. (ex Monitilora ramsayi)]
MEPAAVYYRSSKDRSDVSISAQRRQLSQLAGQRNLFITHEYIDVVESAKTEHRPDFQRLLADLKSPSRTWKYLLMTDHTRLSRDTYVAVVFKRDAKKLGVKIIYAIAPDLDPIAKVYIDSGMEANAEVHSMMSKQKGLAGMAENVRRGFRAGGRAPKGYKLNHIDTGVRREGSPVMKSSLEPNEDAPLVARYMKARAAGIPRAKIKRDLNLAWPASTLIGMEWRALTYAGHTVWNQSNPQEQGRYVGGTKYRPRAEWVIQKDTHHAMISENEAEAILANLQQSSIGAAVSKAKRGLSKYLLTGVLKSPDGRAWTAMKDKYRLKPGNGRKGKYLPIEAIDEAVSKKVIDDMRSPRFIDALLKSAHRQEEKPEDPAKGMRKELIGLNEQISKTMDLAVQLADPAPALRKVNELEARRKSLSEEIERLERDYAVQIAMQSITRDDIKRLVSNLIEDLQDIEKPKLKGVFQAMVDHISLDPERLEFTVNYRLPIIDSLSMASPRGVEPLLPA